jgi:hypothetical protein
MKSSEFARIFGGVVVLLVILFGCLAFIQTLKNSPIWGGDGAAWVQAIGSIAAILGAVWIAREQTRRDQRKSEIDEVRNELAASRILLTLLTLCNNLASASISAAADTDRVSLENVLEDLDALRVPINDVLTRSFSDETIEAALDMQWHVAMGMAKMRRAVAHGRITDFMKCEVSFRWMQSEISSHSSKVELLNEKLRLTLANSKVR